MKRSEIRELAFKLIYSLEIQKVENVQEQIILKTDIALRTGDILRKEI